MRGTLLGNYRVMGQLAEGGMGAVYIGRHEALGRPVAVKVLLPELSCNAEMVQRFFNEAQAATSIRNPGIVQVFDYGMAPDGRAFIVMELLEGDTLTTRLRQRRLDAAECCRISRQVANVLQAAHERGITHRDLKPDNLFLVSDAEVIGGERVKVLDFGIAKLASELHAVGVKTGTTVMMGTPSYMSPEQCRSAVSADPRSDIYSLGCILFEMACGRPPFLGAGMGELIGAHLYTPPPHPQSLAPEIQPALAQLIVHLLAKQPSERPQSMTTVTQSLDGILRALGESPRRAPTPLPELALTLLAVPTPALPFERAPTPAPAPAPPFARDPTPLPARALTPPPASFPRPPAELAWAPHVRETAPASTLTGPPPSAYGSMPPAMPQPSPISTTISGSAGTSSTPPRTGGNRLLLVLGGFVLIAVPAVIAIVLTTDGSAQQEPRPPDEQAPAASRYQDAAITEGAATTPPLAPRPMLIAVDAAVTAPPPRAGAIEAECNKYRSDRKWIELEQCADKLRPLDPKRAALLKTRAVEEAKAAPHIAAAEAALRDKDLKRARTELDQVWPESADYSILKRKYELVEAQAITKGMPDAP